MMRVRLLLPLAMLLWVALPWGAAAQEDDNRPGIAVLPFDVVEFPPVDLSNSGMNFGLQQMFVSELQANDSLRIVDRRAISAVMQELELHGSGSVDAATAAQIGNIVGARYMIGGNYWNQGGNLRLDVRVIDVETTEIPETAIKEGNQADLFELIGELAGDLTAALDLPPLPRVVEEARRSFNPPDDAIILYSRAVGRDEEGDPDAALETLELVVSRWPDYADAAALHEEIRNRSD